MRQSFRITLSALLVLGLLSGCSESGQVGDNSGQEPEIRGVGAGTGAGSGDYFNEMNPAIPEEQDVSDAGDIIDDADDTDENAEESGQTEAGADVEEPSVEIQEGPIETLEICGDGIDNDGNNLTDCNDPVCKGGQTCVELSCGDLEDNDSDGKIDCEDYDCFNADACQVETCEPFYLCLAEEGCSCTMENSCPEPGTEGFIACQQNCSQDENCTQGCVDELGIEKQIHLASFQTCTKNYCALEQDEEDYDQCLIDLCLQEYATCFYGGPIDCGEFYYECGPWCDNDPDCLATCKNALSGDGFTDSVTWDTCRDSLCDLNDDGEFDSDSCYYLASFFACADDAASCIPDHLMKDTGTCKSVTDCLVSCTSFEKVDDNPPCVLSCLEEVGVKNIVQVSNLLSCMIETCGSTAEKLTPKCAAEALANSCQNEWAECSAP